MHPQGFLNAMSPGWGSGRLRPIRRRVPMWDGKRFKELKGTRKPDGQLLSPRNERDTVLSIAPWMLILFQSHPELATGPFLPLPQFPHPPKRGARDAQPVKPSCEQITKLKQNFPMNLPLHFTFRPVTMTDQHPSALKRFYFSISITNSGGNLAPLLSSPPHPPLPGSLSRRSKGMRFPVVCVHASVPAAEERGCYAASLAPFSRERHLLGR